jgi:putative hydrolase of the HAD superfamily
MNIVQEEEFTLFEALNQCFCIMQDLHVIAFDADDTLWVNEPYFREAEEQFCTLLEAYMPLHSIAKELYSIEMKNLPLYGYGVKGFMLSMVETIASVSGNTADIHLVNKALALGQELLQRPIELLDGVEEVLQQLKGRYRLVLATKGDLLDQERKLIKSGLEPYFHHIEIMSDKKEHDYRKLLKRLDCPPSQFLMVGNSLKSDIIPVLDLGGYAVHVPYHTTWEHEKVDIQIDNPRFLEAGDIREVLQMVS